MPETGLDLGVLLGNTPDGTAGTLPSLQTVTLLAAQSGLTHAKGTGALMNLPPAEFVASAYAAFFRRVPQPAIFVALRDRLLRGEISRVQLLKQLAKDSSENLKGLKRTRWRNLLRRSPPAEAVLLAGRTARTLYRLPRNIRRAAAPKKPHSDALHRPAAGGKDRPRIAVVAPASPSGEMGGAERFYLGLCDALEQAGLNAELVAPQAREDSFAHSVEAYRTFHALDLSAYDGVISTKAPAYAIRHPNHVCYLVHTIRAWYDMFGASHPFASALTHAHRRRIQALDTAALQGAKKLFAIGEEVAVRLRRFNGLEAESLHFPSTLQGLKPGEFRHLFLPGRLHPWKRVDLAIRAMRHVAEPVKLIIAGTGQEEAALRALAKDDPRIAFTGRISDEELAALYNDALAVLFLPRQEDLGLVTFEAFASGKPVICCSDSGEPARVVRDGTSGFICPPEARAIAARITELARDPGHAMRMGEMGRASTAAISWDQVARALSGALGF